MFNLLNLNLIDNTSEIVSQKEHMHKIVKQAQLEHLNKLLQEHTNSQLEQIHKDLVIAFDDLKKNPQ